jgi:hypothetical protein
LSSGNDPTSPGGEGRPGSADPEAQLANALATTERVAVA